MVRPVGRKDIAAYLISEYQMSIRQACKLSSISRWVYYHRPDKTKDEPVQEKLRTMAEAHPAYGFWKMYRTIRREQLNWNHKRVYRIYIELGMNIRRKVKRRLPKREKHPLNLPMQQNCIWSIDFMSDSLVDGRRFRTLNIIDDFNRESLAIEVDTNLSSQRVTRVLGQLAETRGLPKEIRCDNGPEFVSNYFANWCLENKIQIKYTQPGKPVQNAYIERFNKSYRAEVLNAYLFHTINDVRELTEEFIINYNNNRPHESLNNLTPIDFLKSEGAFQKIESNFTG